MAGIGQINITSATVTASSATVTPSSGSMYYTFFPMFTTSSDTASVSDTITGVEIFLLVIFILLTVFTVIGNTMALSVFARIPLSKTVSVIFFMSMGLADLANGICMMPFSIYSLAHPNRNLNMSAPHFQSYCVFSGIVMNTANKASLFTLILICFDRFLSVYDALHKGFIMTVKNCSILVFLCWFFSLLIAIFPYFIKDRNSSYLNYYYFRQTAQCDYAVTLMFDMGSTIKFQHRHGGRYPNNVLVGYFFLNILPIIIPTYAIVFFCAAVIAILRNIFKNSKRLRQLVEPETKPSRKSLVRNSVNIRSLSFKRKASEKTIQLDKVEAGYKEIHTGTGTASDNLEGEVVLRRQSRRMTKQTISPRDRWSQMSMKSLQKRTKADHQQKAIKTVVMMLMFFVLCYLLSWFNIAYGLLFFAGLVPKMFTGSYQQRYQLYFFTMSTIMKYVNCAGNPFLYYFRMTQFKREVEGIKASWNGTTNRNCTSASTSRHSRPTSGARDSSYRLSDHNDRGSFKQRGSLSGSTYKGTPNLRGSIKRVKETSISPSSARAPRPTSATRLHADIRRADE